jgi:hypothetical protein
MSGAELGLAGFICTFTFLALRLNSILERNLEAKRLLHSILLPLYHYLGLLDHELQSEVREIDNLFRQAVLDHVTELRAFLLQPSSKDLVLWGSPTWVNSLNNILLALEDSLENEVEDLDPIELKGQVVHLLNFIKDQSDLNRLISRPLGLVNYSER